MSRSKELFEKAKRLMPGGVNSPVRSFRSVGLDPLVVSRAKGSRIYDVDGRSYIDYVMSWGPLILGHAHDEVVGFIKEVAERGTTYGITCELEIMMAEKVVSAKRSVERVRFVNSGTEATMSAIRLARAYTGRKKIVKFEGCYHGHVDSLLVKAGSGVLTFGIPGTPGVPEEVVSHTIVAKYNDVEGIREIFEKYGEDIACVIVEPVVGNSGVIVPKIEFLNELRSLTKNYGSVLIFDEVITGFRLAYGGAEEYFRIDADLVCLGKIIGGGLPVGAYGGSADIMEMVAPSGPVYQAGTLSGNPLAMAAGLKTLEVLEREKPYDELAKKTSFIGNELEKIFKEKGMAVTINYIASMISVFFREPPVESFDDAVKSDTSLFAKFFSKLLDKGVYIPPSQFEAWFVSTSHTWEDIEHTVEAIRKVVRDL
ncbi:MAG: glutamate-1-semialdehyde 2,1-aminomutase [Thermosulfidibacteraceae bacterium]